MLVVPKYQGINLPIVDPDTTVLSNANVFPESIEEETAASGAKTFYRTVRVNLGAGSQPETVDALVARTDEELTAVAALCGAKVVEHTWGLYRTPGAQRVRRYGAIALPQGCQLVAEVELIRGEAMALYNRVDPEASELVRAGIRSYYADGKGSYQLSDFQDAGHPRLNQFMLGVSAERPEAGSQAWLVDIDPHFATTA